MCLLSLLLLNPRFTQLLSNTNFTKEMDDIFEKLRSQGQDTVAGVVQWMREANIIGPEESSENQTRDSFETEDGSDKVGLEAFKATLEKISRDCGFDMEVVAQEFIDKASSMESAFEKLKKEGKNDVDNLVKWMKDSIWPTEEAASPPPTTIDDILSDSFTNIIGAAKEAEDKARKLFEGAQNQKNIDLETFKNAIARVAEEQKKNADELMKTLAEKGPKLMDAVQAGASAFKEALTKK
ncbi:hypothetical protein MSG28_015506 [Choristoneura fumiferana]|uniref:Uncharacterized protein n=1 Tax=Choristoneura fumiferana TaxID=7141 RepID=A0ACC0KBP2_CHOFU|nr:hypothetical protein MSG28_015506 [Choristoneura fumiferana]